MPTSVGPNTFGEENLVFGYDLGDVSNSYKGEPTVNLVTNPDFATGNYSGWSSTGVGGAVQITGVFSENGYNYFHKKVNKVTAGGLDRIIQSSVYTINTSLQTTVTFDIWINPLNAYGITFYGLGSTADDTTYDEKPLSSNGTTVKTVSLGGGWNRYIYTLSTAWYTGTGNTFRVAVYPDYGGTGLLEYKLRRVQVEQKSHATPFVNGTRSATQGLIDLTGNSTINLSTVSFDSNAQVIFDGTDDSITCGTPAYSNRRDFTFVAWVKSDGVLSAARRGLFNASNMSTGYISFFGYTGGAGTLLFETRDSTNSTYLGIGSQAFNIYSGEWVMVGFQIKQGALALFYHNSTTFYYNETADSRTGNFSFQNFGVGSDSSAFRWDGYIDGVRFYDRVLTQDELKANFKALKTRFI